MQRINMLNITIMKKLFLIISFILLASVMQAQHYYIGLKSGVKKPVYTLFQQSDSKYKTGMVVFFPTGTIIFKYTFPNNVEVGTGIGYYTYDYPIDTTDHIPSHAEFVFQAITIPLNFGYNIPLYKGLKLQLNSGVNFDFYFGSGLGSFGGMKNIYLFNKTNHNFNILLSNQMALTYTTKFNMTIALFGAYHAGLRNVYESPILKLVGEYNPDALPGDYSNYEYDATAKTRGSYWLFGFELGYHFNKKNKVNILKSL